MSARPWPALAAALAAAVLGMGAMADPADRLPNPAQEARARGLFRELRCVVCQNESIDDSEADIASDLRRIVRGQIAAGQSDDEVRAFLVQRYGEFILLKPPLTPGNAALWLTPAFLIVFGGGYLWLAARRPRSAVEPILSPEEELALNDLAAGTPDGFPALGHGRAGSGEIGAGR